MFYKNRPKLTKKENLLKWGSVILFVILAYLADKYLF